MPNQLRLAGNAQHRRHYHIPLQPYTRERESTILFLSSSPFSSIYISTTTDRRCYVWASLCILYNLNTISNGRKMYYTHNCWELHYNLECFKKLFFFFSFEMRWRNSLKSTWEIPDFFSFFHVLNCCYAFIFSFKPIRIFVFLWYKRSTGNCRG